MSSCRTQILLVATLLAVMVAGDGSSAPVSSTRLVRSPEDALVFLREMTSQGWEINIETNGPPPILQSQTGRVVVLTFFGSSKMQPRLASSATVFFPKGNDSRPLFWLGSDGWYDWGIESPERMNDGSTAVDFESAAVTLVRKLAPSIEKPKILTNSSGTLYAYRWPSPSKRNFGYFAAAVLADQEGHIVAVSMATFPPTGDPR